MRIQADGSLLVGTTDGGSSGAGDIVASAIFLGGNQAANELDDYEEGTWTPAFTLSTTAPTSLTVGNINAGHYTKIGNVVHFMMSLHVNAYAGGSGRVDITGWPFANTATYTARFMSASFSGNYLNWESDWTSVNLHWMDASQTKAQLVAMRDNAASEAVTNSQYPTGNTYQFATGYYYTDS
jgi:hypothetical protein